MTRRNAMKEIYVGYQSEPMTDCERERLKRLRACNDNELSTSEREEKRRLLGKLIFKLEKKQ